MRTETIERTIYTFNELDPDIQDRVMESYRENYLDYDWWDCLYDDVADIADLIGIDIRHTPIRRMDGKPAVRDNGRPHYNPTIYFSGFYHQGSGSSFRGDYSYRKGALKAVKAYAPNDTDLHSIVADLQEVQRRNFYSLNARVSPYRDTSISVDTVYKDDDIAFSDDDYDLVVQAMRDFNSWIFSRLESEYEYLMSDESIRESIIANQYEFDSEGSII